MVTEVSEPTYTVGQDWVIGFWRPEKPGTCWVCGEETEYAYLDIDYQHPDCEMFPSPQGNVKVVRGIVVSIE